MRRTLTTAAATLLFAAFAAGTASADIDANPNSRSVSDVQCEGGLSFEALWAATPQNVVGHDLDGNRVGVAKSVYATLPNGTPFPGVPPLFDRPGQGLDGITVWCFWPDELSPTLYAGGEILFNANLRP